MNTTQAPDQLFGYEVRDSSGNKIGSVDNVWVDDATSGLEFVGVKTGWLMGKIHAIPTADAQIDGDNRVITVPYSESQVKEAPSFGSDDELTPDSENQVYSHYGLDRTTSPSPTGLAEGQSSRTDTGDDSATSVGTDFAAETNRGDYTAEADRADVSGDVGERRVQLAEEELQVGKRQVEAGRLRLRKVVNTEQQQVPVELQREEVDIERVPVSGQAAADTAFQEEDIEVPVMREEPVVAKQAQVAGEVRVGKDVRTETQTVGDTVRREDVEVERDDTAQPELNRTDTTHGTS